MVAKARSAARRRMAAPSKERPDGFWPFVIAAMALTASWGIQRISQSLWGR